MAEACTTSMEVVDLDQEGKVHFSSKTKQEFGQVVFHNIARYYPTDAHVNVTFAVTSQMTANKWDWIGLFKVGWVKSSEKISYEWVVIPADYKEQQEIETHVLFQAHNLPKDDGEFYQFCYIASGGQVRGASTPFQFRSPRSDDFEEAEDEDIDLIIINNRAQHLEERINQVEMEKQELLRAKDALDADRESLVEKLVEFQKQVQEQQEKANNQQRALSRVQDELITTQAQAKDMAALQEEKIERLTKEKDDLSQALEAKEIEIARLTEELQTVNREKDELSGRVKTLEQEKELYKGHFTNSESAIKAHTLEIENLQKQNSTHENELAECRTENSELRRELEKEKRELAQLRQLRNADQEQAAAVSEKLKNTEDKLEAAEACKQMLSQESEALRAAYTQMSDNLEKAKSESHTFKDRLTMEEKRFKEELESARNALDMIKKEKEQADHRLQDQEEQIVSLQAKLQSEEAQMQNDAAGAAFALQPVLTDLKDRYKKYKNKFDMARMEKDSLTKQREQWKQQEQDLRREVEDLKARLKMGAEEYKTLHIQYQKAVKKFNVKEQKVERKAPLVEEMLTEVAQQLKATEQEAADETPAAEARAQAEGSEDYEVVTSIVASSLTSEELQAQFDDLGQELEKRTMKKKMYKQKFMDEKEKNTFLRSHYEEELKKKTYKINELSETIESMEKDMAGNEKRLAEVCNKQKLEITRLNGLLAAERGNKKASVSLPPEVYTPPSPPVVMEYGNPYEKEATSVVGRQTDVVDGIGRLALGDPISDVAENAPVLTPPLKPEVLPSAKMAAVMAVNQRENGSSSSSSSSSSNMEADDFPRQDLLEANTENLARTVPPPEEAETPDAEEEKFEDAVGAPLPQCPICSKPFQGDNAEVQISEHIDKEHTGPECPMCHKVFSVGTVQGDFERHVQSHFDENDFEFA